MAIPMRRAAHDHAADVAALLRAVLESPGVSDLATREAAYQGTPIPGQLGTYVAKVRDASYRLGDADTAALLAAGYPQDAVFEITIAAALGAAGRGLAAGLRAIREGD